MKKTTRLTALLLALVLLLGTLSASATETTGGISLYNLTGEMYEELLAEAVSVGLTANQPCGTNNPYCASVTLIGAMATAQERYDYLAGLSGTAAQNVLMHYYEKHTAEETLCLCAYPAFDAEYVPGGINHDEDCPWHFANLPVEEQFDVLILKNEVERTSYLATVQDADKVALLNAYLEYAKNTYTEPCDPDTCPYNAQYTDIDFFSANIFEVYEYLYEMNTKAIDADFAARTEYLNLAAHLRDAHIAEGRFCQCMQFDMSNREHAYGTLNHSNSDFCGVTIDCPWRFDRLTTAEQAQVLSQVDESEHAEYYALLSDKQKAELDAFLAGVGETDKTITTNKDSGEGSTEPEVQVNISVPAGVFGAGVEHVMEAGEALMTTEKTEALNAVSTGHTLAAFDITFYNLNRPGEKLQPVNGTVPLTFTVDVSAVEGDSMQVYHVYEEDGQYKAEAVGEPIAVDKSSGMQTLTINAESFSVYALRSGCDGETCGYNAFVAMNGFEREAELIRLLGITTVDEGDEPVGFDTYDKFISHINQYHYEDESPYCTCSFYETKYAQYGYGSIGHEIDSITKEYCLWHFSQVSVADEYIVYQDMSEADKAAALQSIEGTEKYDQLMALINPPEIVEPEIKADTTSVELSFAADATGHQWYQSTDGGITWTAVVGAESATLTLDLSQSADALGYIYKCTATIDGEQVESQLMGLTNAQFRGWLLDGADAITVTMAMLNRALEVQAVLDARDADYGALKALRLEGTELYSVYTGEVIADFNPDTRALVDRSMGLTVGYVDFTNGTIVAPPVDETTGGDETAN